jgi:hypothetical protein
VSARAKPASIRFYVDVDLLGLAKILVQVRSDVTYPGDPGEVLHRRERPPCVITNTEVPDTVWIPSVAQEGWLIVSRDSNVAAHRAEIEAVRLFGAKMVALAALPAMSITGSRWAPGAPSTERLHGNADRQWRLGYGSQIRRLALMVPGWRLTGVGATGISESALDSRCDDDWAWPLLAMDGWIRAIGERLEVSDRADQSLSRPVVVRSGELCCQAGGVVQQRWGGPRSNEARPPSVGPECPTDPGPLRVERLTWTAIGPRQCRCGSGLGAPCRSCPA